MPTRPSPLTVPLGVALMASAALLVGAALPGWLAAEPGAMIRQAYSVLCHQLPHRSPHLGGGTWALCHRCTGIAAGLVLGLVMFPFAPTRVADRLGRVPPGRLLVACLVPMSIDWALGASGVWMNTPVSRVATGALFGLAAGGVLALGLTRTHSTVPASTNLLST